jgi:hypothetical protein
VIYSSAGFFDIRPKMRRLKSDFRHGEAAEAGGCGSVSIAPCFPNSIRPYAARPVKPCGSEPEAKISTENP